MMPPTLYRYMDEEFVGRFFETGELLLSSFARYKELSDIRRDDSEGQAMIQVIGEPCAEHPDGFTAFIVGARGSDCYSLSTSATWSEDIRERLGVSSGFRIDNAPEFHLAVMGAIPDCRYGFIAKCTYQEQRIIQRTGAAAKFFDLESRSLEYLMEYSMGMMGAEPLFVKLHRDAWQDEWRLLWRVPREVSGLLLVRCPAAVRFCSRL